MSELTTGTVNVSRSQILAESCRAAVLNAINQTDARIAANFEELEASALRLRASMGTEALTPSELKLQLDNTFVQLKNDFPEASDKAIQLAALSGSGLGTALDQVPAAFELPPAEFAERITLAFAKQELNQLQEAVRLTAMDAGFGAGEITHHRSDINYQFTLTDAENHHLTVVSKLGKENDLQLMLDLDGYDCAHDQCNNKMQEMIQRLAEKGYVIHMPIHIKHHQPRGVLRSILAGKKKPSAPTFVKPEKTMDTEAYLTGKGSSFHKQDNLNKQ